MLTIKQLPFPAIGKPAEDYILSHELALGQWRIAIGTTVKLKQTENFGCVVLPKDTQDVRDFTVPKRIFLY